MLAATDRLLPAEIALGLKARRLTGPVHHFDDVASTNDLAKELAAQGAPEGTLVVAEAQTGGRGRLGRQWEFAPGQRASTCRCSSGRRCRPRRCPRSP